MQLDLTESQCSDLRTLAYTYIQQGVLEVPLSIFHTLLLTKGPNAYDLQTLGALYLQKGEDLKALEFLDQALKIDPSHLKTKLNRAKALFALGYKKQGLALSTTLATSTNRSIANQAAALLLAFH